MMCKNPYMKNENGITKSARDWSFEARIAGTPFPCGQCLHCRINKARTWTLRIVLESLMHKESSFWTLTYEDEKCPVIFKKDGTYDYTLKPIHMQAWMKSIRSKIAPEKIRFFGVGEYGDKTERPHYHVILFGMSTLQAAKLSNTWKHGYVHIGEINQDSARYISGYVTKKLDKNNPQLGGRCPEYMRSSRKPGIGKPAVKSIAEAFKRYNKWDGRIVRELNLGKKTYPLGRYLTAKIAEEMGITQKQATKEFMEYSEELHEKHGTGCLAVENILQDNKQRRLKQEKRQHLFFKKGCN